MRGEGWGIWGPRGMSGWERWRFEWVNGVRWVGGVGEGWVGEGWVMMERGLFVCGGGHRSGVDVQGFADFCYHLQYAYCRPTYETLAKMMSVRPRTRMSRMTSSSVRLVCSSLRSSSNGISRGSSGGTPSFTSPAHSHTYSRWKPHTTWNIAFLPLFRYVLVVLWYQTSKYYFPSNTI